MVDCNVTPIYAMIVFSPNAVSQFGRIIAPAGRTRVWGFFHEIENARECIETNATDIFENEHYEYGIVATMTVGPLSVADDEEWYKAIYENGEFVRAERIEKPEDLKNMMFGF